VTKGPSLRFRAAYAARPSPFRVEIDEALEMATAGALLVDVRRDEGEGTILPGAVRITPDQIPGRLPTFPRDVPIVLACT
jgi:rhodanese-related sulfurtransferase